MEDPLRDAAADPGLTLIETMFWDGRAVRFERLHRARLATGARALGWACPRFALSGPDRPARLRLTLDSGGRIRQTAGPLPPSRAVWRVGLAAARLHADDPWLRVKSSRRAVYDRARAALPPGLDEALLCNEQGAVCDGTITTVFFDRGAGLRTPPLADGLLPGVLRTALACPEERLWPDELGRVRLWLGNALRGLAPARFIP